MTNDELIRDRVQSAMQLLTEVLILLPAPPPSSPLHVVWNNGVSFGFGATLEQRHGSCAHDVDATENPPKGDYFDTIDGTPIIPTDFARRFYRTSDPSQTKKAPAVSEAQKAETVFLEFTTKELSKMPKFFRTIYKLKGGKAAHIRQRANGTYEIRYRRDGINLSVSAKVLEVAKERFVQALASAKAETFNDRVTFEQFATQWLEVVKKPQVKTNTWETYLWTLKTYVFPRFGKLRLKDIKPTDVQKLLNAMEAKNITRGAQGVYVLLKPIFEFAIAEELIPRSPMRLIQKPKFEVKHGQAFTVDEEREFIEKCMASDCPYRYYLILLLFTGIRRSELPSVELTPQWVTVTTSKTRKGESIKKRRIPVSPMLKPFLPFLKMDSLPSDPDILSRWFKKFAAEKHLHELRHTFITRCQECGISRELTSLWAGHKADNTMTSNVYTHFSEDFQLGEIKKLRY